MLLYVLRDGGRPFEVGRGHGRRPVRHTSALRRVHYEHDGTFEYATQKRMVYLHEQGAYSYCAAILHSVSGPVFLGARMGEGALKAEGFFYPRLHLYKKWMV